MTNKSLIRAALCALLLLAWQHVGAAQKPELAMQSGHFKDISDVVHNADGSLLASAGRDGQIILWDAAEGTQLRMFKQHDDIAYSVAFSPDGKILAASFGAQIKLWDVETGGEMQTIESNFAVEKLAFHPDGKSLAGAISSMVIIWSVGTDGAEEAKPRYLKSTEDDNFRTVAFSPDGQLLAAGGKSRSIVIWQVEKEEKDAPPLLTLPPTGQQIISISFSRDGRTLASGGGDIGEPELILWNVADGKRLRTLQGHSSRVNAVAFSGDGRTLASGSADREIKLWDTTSGAQRQTLKSASSVESLSFSPDGETLAVGYDDWTIKLWGTGEGKVRRTLGGSTRGIWQVAFSPDRRYLMSAEFDRAIRLWSTTGGGEFRSLSGISPVAFSPDGKILAASAGPRTETIKLWDVGSGAELRAIAGNTISGTEFAISPDGKLLSAGTWSGKSEDRIMVWDAATGREVRALAGFSSLGATVAFSPDGKLLAAGADSTEEIRVWDVQTWKLLRALKTDSGTTCLVFSPDSKLLVSGGVLSSKVWDVRTGREMLTLDDRNTGATQDEEGEAEKEIESVGGVFSLALSPDGQTIAVASGNPFIGLYEISTGKKLRELTGHSAWVQSVAFSPDGKYLASGSEDAQTKLWDAKTGVELASLIALNADDWLVVTPDGLFDGTPSAWKQLLWRFSSALRDTAPVEQFFNEFYYPGLLAELLAGKRPAAPANIAQLNRRQPLLKLTTAPPTTASTDGRAAVPGRVLAVRIEIAEAAPVKEQAGARSGARDVRLFRNGSLVKVWHGDVLKGQSSITLETDMPVVAGENRLTAYAFNSDNVKSADATLFVNGAESLRRKGVMYVVAVGVNKYAPNRFFRNLRYAVADAEEFSKEIKRQQEQLGRTERVELTTLTDASATKANILDVLAQIAKKAQPEDTVVVYFAGHGLAVSGQFHLIPHDIGAEAAASSQSDEQAALKAALATRSVSDRELEQAFEGIDAGQLAMIIDACNSGQALGGEREGRGPMNSKGLAQFAYDKGMYVLTAAQSYQAAHEASQVGHGLLTYALIEEGLKQSAADNEPKDGKIVLREWLDYATGRVPLMQISKMKAAQGRGLNLSFKDEEREVEVEKRSGQQPRVFYRRESETQPLVIARPASAP